MTRNAFRLFLLIALILSACSKSRTVQSPTQAPADPQNTPTIVTPEVQKATTLPKSANVATDSPLQVQVSEEIDLTNFHPVGKFTVSFNKRMDPRSAPEAIITYPFVQGEITWTDDNKKLAFSPTQGFIPGETYWVYLSRDLKSNAGEFFTTTRKWEIKIQNAPIISSHSPTVPQLQDSRPTIKITFDREMDSKSVEAALSITPDVSFRLEWYKTTVSLHFTQPLVPGKQYHLNVESSARDSEGVPLIRSYSWNYWLEKFQISVHPYPEHDERYVRLSFNYPVNTTKTGFPFKISPSISGDWQWIDDKTARFTTEKPIPQGIKYTLGFISPIYATNGDALPLPDNPITFAVSPPVIKVEPADDHVASGEFLVKVHFDQPMDHTSVEDAFDIKPGLDGEFEWNGNTLIFHPNTLVNQNQLFTATIEPAALNAAGKVVFSDPYTWSFFPPNWWDMKGVFFSEYGANAQVVDANGRRALQFGINADLPARVTCDLFQYELIDYVDLYTRFFRDDYYSFRTGIETNQTESFYSWQVIYDSGGLQELTIPAEIPPGLYVINLSLQGTLQDQLFLILTANTIMIKEFKDELLVWVSAINGSNLAGSEVRLYSDRGEKIRVGKTDGNGLYRTTVPDGYSPLLVAARGEGGDFTISGLSNQWSSRYNYGWWWGRQDAAKAYNAYIYTDRPIYKPGQTVYYKVILRKDTDVKYTLPLQDIPIILQVKDAQNNIIQTDEAYPSEFGTTNGEFRISEGAMLGDYYITANIQDDYFQQKFKVQDYRKPDYQVTITSDKTDYVAGEKVKLNINVKYLFGKPVKNAILSWTKYQLTSYYGWCDVMDCGNVQEYNWYGSVMGPINKADENGNYETTVSASLGEEYSRYTSRKSSQSYSLWAIEVTARDGSSQTVSGYVIYKVYDSGEMISLDTNGFLKSPGESFNLSMSAQTYQGEPLNGKSLTLEINRWNGVTWEYDTITDTIDLMTKEDGTVELPLSLDRTGYYMLRVWGKDTRQHDMQHTRWIYVQSSNSTWTRTTQQDLNIIADKDSYKPYQKARFMIESSFDGAGLLTFERGRVNRAIPVNLTAPLTLVEVDIIPEDAPNIYATINVWQAQDTRLSGEDEYYSSTNIPDSKLRTASVELQVDPAFIALNVKIIPDKEIYQPRQKATITLSVADDQGKPVSAEVSLAMVDESIYSLNNELTQPIFQAFYGRRANTVETYDSMAPYREISYLGRGGGGGDDMAINPRSAFPDTAVWLPSIQTDETGQAIVVIDLPDTLTSWRLTARAVTKTTRVGETKVNILTQQEVMIRPVLPTSMVSGDQMQLSALVHNYAEEHRQVEVILQSSALEITTSPSITLDLMPGEIYLVEWSVLATEPGTTDVIITARSDGEVRDSIKLPLDIMPLAIKDNDSQVGSFVGEYNASIIFPSDALPISNIKISLSRSMAGNVLFGLDYLTGYPYGCVEQTMSRALPNVVVGRALSQLGLTDAELLVNLPSLINNGLQRLYGFQHLDGGWGWWYDDLTDDYQTAWVVFGLSITEQAGYPVDEDVIVRGSHWLNENLGGMDIRTRAFALYSMNLAGQSNMPAELELFEQAQELDPFSQSTLALSLYRSGEKDKARLILHQITDVAQIQNGQAFWLAFDSDGEYTRKTMTSSLRSTAMVLEALTQIDPTHPLIPKIAKYLVEKRRAYGWGSTNETAFAVIALTDYLTTLEADQSTVNYSIELNGSEFTTGSLDQGQSTAELIINSKQLKYDANHLRITHDSSGPLYFSTLSNMFISKPTLESKGKIRVTRAYLDIHGNPIKAVTAGDIVKIQLNITLPDPGSFIILEDRLPAGLEAINEKLNTATHDAFTLASEYQVKYYWEEYGYNYKEIHPDRVSFFITDLKTGTFTYVYLARATIQGSFVALPAEVYAMYDPEFWGSSSSGTISITSP